MQMYPFPGAVCIREIILFQKKHAPACFFNEDAPSERMIFAVDFASFGGSAAVLINERSD